MLFAQHLFLDLLFSCIRCVVGELVTWRGRESNWIDVEVWVHAQTKREKPTIFLGWLNAIHLPVILEILPWQKKWVLSRTLNNEEFQTSWSKKILTGLKMHLNSSLNSVVFHANPFYLLLQHQWELEHHFVSRKLFLKTIIKGSHTGLHWIVWERHWLLMSSIWQPGKQ